MGHTKLIVRAVFGIIGNFISLGLFASPVPTFYRVTKSNSVKEVKPEIHLLTTMNCLFWVLYGLPVVRPGNILVLTANGFGLVMHLAYLFIFLLYARDNKKRMYVGGVLLIELAVTGLVGGLVIGLVHTILARRVIIGSFCCVFAAMMYSPRICHVVAKESTDDMPFPLVVTNILNDLCWMIYCLLRFDITLWYAYLTGLVVGVIQLIRHGSNKSTLKSSDEHLQKIEKCDDEKLDTEAQGTVAA